MRGEQRNPKCYWKTPFITASFACHDVVPCPRLVASRIAACTLQSGNGSASRTATPAVRRAAAWTATAAVPLPFIPFIDRRSAKPIFTQREGDRCLPPQRQACSHSRICVLSRIQSPHVGYEAFDHRRKRVMNVKRG